MGVFAAGRMRALLSARGAGGRGKEHQGAMLSPGNRGPGPNNHHQNNHPGSRYDISVRRSRPQRTHAGYNGVMRRKGQQTDGNADAHTYTCVCTSERRYCFGGFVFNPQRGPGRWLQRSCVRVCVQPAAGAAALQAERDRVPATLFACVSSFFIFSFARVLCVCDFNHI